MRCIITGISPHYRHLSVKGSKTPDRARQRYSALEKRWVFREFQVSYELVTAIEGLDKSSRRPSLLSRALSFLNQVLTWRASTCSLFFRSSKLFRISAYLVKSFISGLGVSSYHFLNKGISTVVLKTIFFPRGVINSFLPGDIEPSSSCSLLS